MELIAMSSQAVPGRRERKKAATRQALADAALRLFVERGYDKVTVREIADAVDVSTTTLLKHFPSKEALVFDRDSEVEHSLISAVTTRPSSCSLLASLRIYTRARVQAAVSAPGGSDFLTLVLTTPALTDYWHKMWMRHEDALVRTLADEVNNSVATASCTALAHFALGTMLLAIRSKNPTEVVDAAFDILERGWEMDR